ncbi:MAG: hypothetical protein GY822_24645 [Deltaproteobacteria bacterium]|nr:hypothetical protein [Deltaproteobacteria bacterium]
MAQRSRRRSNRSRSTGEPNGLQPGDDIGNRRKKLSAPIPPDDIGNRKGKESHKVFPEDDVGNRVDVAPTHDHSALDTGSKKRKKRSNPLVRVGRFFAGGVNPLVSHNLQRSQKAMDTLLDVQKSERLERRAQERAARYGDEAVAERDESRSGERNVDERTETRQLDRQERFERQARSSRQDLQERRAARFFDFVEDDRFEYTLKSEPEDKRKQAQDSVEQVLKGAGRDATIHAQLVEDGIRSKVLVSIDDNGPAADLPEARRPEGSKEPLFVLGNAALMSLNYLVNKIVNRYPSDRIRLVILPKADEKTYLDGFAAHKAQREGASEATSDQAVDDKKIEAADDKKIEAADEKKLEAADEKEIEAVDEKKIEAVDDKKIEAVEVKAKTKKAPAKKATAKKTNAKKATAKKAIPKQAESESVEAKEGESALVDDLNESSTSEDSDAASAKPPAKKATAKKAPAKKAAAKKTTAKKATAKKATAKKATAKKAPAKKATAKKAAAKKSASKEGRRKESA